MISLISGIGLWSIAHFFKRMFPGPRDAMGKWGRLVMTILIVGAVVLMVLGYKATWGDPLYVLPGAAWHVNNVMMLIAIYFVNMGKAPGVLRTKIRHPMLIGMLLWSIAHLLVNGDVPSLILFGGLGLWAGLEMVVINRAEGPWEPPAPGHVRMDIFMGGVAIIVYAVIAGIHHGLGVPVIKALM